MSENTTENQIGEKYPFIEEIDLDDMKRIPKKDWVSITVNNMVALTVFTVGMMGIPVSICCILYGLITGDLVGGAILALKLVSVFTAFGMVMGLAFGVVHEELHAAWETPFENTVDIVRDKISTLTA